MGYNSLLSFLNVWIVLDIAKWLLCSSDVSPTLFEFLISEHQDSPDLSFCNPRTSHFSMGPYFLFVEMVFRSQNLGGMCVCYCGGCTSPRLSVDRTGNYLFICVDLHSHIDISVHKNTDLGKHFMFIFTSQYVCWNLCLHWYIQFESKTKSSF